MNIRNAQSTTFVLVVLLSVAPVPSLAQNYSSASVSVCNKGQININVVIGEPAPLPLFNHDLVVTAWVSIAPGACRQVYHTVGDNRTGTGTERAYLGFGFSDPQGQLMAGHASRLPDLGIYALLTPVIAASKDRFCARWDAFRYRIAEHAEFDCSTFRAGANDPGGYTSFTTALTIQPVAAFCSNPDAPYTCHDGAYYLDVIATHASPEIQLTGRIGASQSPGSGGPDSSIQVLQQLAQAAAEEGKKRAQAQAAAAAEVKRQDEEQNRAQWAGTRQSPAAYAPQWMGQKIVIVGTVSRVEVDSAGSPRWVSIFFKESPDATFVVCSPYPDMLQEKVGRNLNALVGKTLEAAGQVESPYCGGKMPKGSIRVVESNQWQVR
jgi:hypothetical protein